MDSTIVYSIVREAISFATKKLPFGGSVLSGYIYELLGIAPKTEDKITPALKELNGKIDKVMEKIDEIKEEIKNLQIKESLNAFDNSVELLLAVTKQFSAEVQELSTMDIDTPPYQIQLYNLYEQISHVQIEGNGYVFQAMKIGRTLLPQTSIQRKGVLQIFSELTSDREMNLNYQNYVLGIYVQAYGLSMLYLNFLYDEQSPVQQKGTKQIMDDLFSQMQQVNQYAGKYAVK